MIGRVVSTKMNNTAAVLVARIDKHPLYKKTYVQSKKFLADMGVKVVEGDMVEIVKIRPISKNKHWRIARVIGQDLAEINEKMLKAEAEKVIAEVMPAGKMVEPPVVSSQTEEKTEDKTKETKNKKGKA